MPLKKAKGKGEKAIQKAVSTNIQELTRANREKPAGKKRSEKQIRSTNVQLTTSAPIAQSTCYGLPFQNNALGGLCKTHNYSYG